MKEKLIALLMEAMEEGEKECLSTANCPDCRAYEKYSRDECGLALSALHLIANGVVVREWIPVTERLPQSGRYLICQDFSGTRYVGVATYAEDLYQLDEYDFYHYRRKKKGGFVDYSSEGYYELTHITHWMPLPEPPMRKGENG